MAIGTIALMSSLGTACDPGSLMNMGPDVGELDEGIVCQAELTLTGTLQPSGALPAPEDGCVPFGTWTISVELFDPGDCPDVPVASTYVYEVSANPEGGYAYTFPSDPVSELIKMSVTQGGPGDCQGSFEHHSVDGMSMLLLKPFERDLSISGKGYYEIYTSSQY